MTDGKKEGKKKLHTHNTENENLLTEREQNNTSEGRKIIQRKERK